ncbi:MAG: hypothetical protein H6R14_796 [Proteobacteria bacterium]|nr:hypothetical protein [Pseudomonadota bacterium]
MITAQIIHDSALLEEVAVAAAKRGWHIISNGKRAVISPIIPAGWTKIAVKVKTARSATLEAQPCAA